MKKILAALLAAVLLSGCAFTDVFGTTSPAVAEAMAQETVFKELFAPEERIAMTLTWSDGSVYGPYYTYRLPEELTLKGLQLTDTEMPELGTDRAQLAFSAGDGSLGLTVYGGSPELLAYRQGKAVRYYEAPEGTFQALRQVFDRLQRLSLGNIAFFTGRSGKAVIQVYAETALPNRLYELAPGSGLRILDYQVRDVDLTGKDGKVLQGLIRFALKPEQEEMGQLPILGRLLKEEDGWLLYEKALYIEHQADGQWHEISGTAYETLQGEEIPPFDPAAAEPDLAAQIYLGALPEKLEELQQLRSEADAIRLAEAFLQTSTAVTLARKTDFDWKPFFEDKAMQNTGVRAFFKMFVNREGAEGFFSGRLRGKLDADIAELGEETSLVAGEGVQLRFVKSGMRWLISDIALTDELTIDTNS